MNLVGWQLLRLSRGQEHQREWRQRADHRGQLRGAALRQPNHHRQPQADQSQEQQLRVPGTIGNLLMRTEQPRYKVFIPSVFLLES